MFLKNVTSSLIALALLFLLNACGPEILTPEENLQHYKVGKPYTVKEQTYIPKQETNYVEEGMASWYGGSFHHNRTANGEKFDTDVMTAAHRTLPLPSIVRVTNLANGKSVNVRINDRGPFVKNRIIDVSEEAARQLDFKRAGSAKVRVEYLPEETAALFPPGKNPAQNMLITAMHSENLPSVVNSRDTELIEETENTPLPTQPQPIIAPQKYAEVTAHSHITAPIHNSSQPFEHTHFIQVGAFKFHNNALAVQRKIAHLGKTVIVENKHKGTKLYIVEIGPIQNKTSLRNTLKKLSGFGFKDAKIVTG